VSADQRVNAAREYLAAIRRHKVTERPLSALVRECADLRRMLGRVLDVADDLEVMYLDQDSTQVMLWGGVYLTPADTGTVMRALSDAAQCADDEHFPSSPTDGQAARYRELHDRIRSQS